MCIGTHPFIPAPNTAQVAVRSVWDGQQVENVFWATKPGSPFAPGDLESIADVFSTWYLGDILPYRAANFIGVEVQVTDYTSEFGDRFTDPSIAGIPGGSSEEAMPNNVTWKINFPVAVRGQHAGGVYHLGLVDTEVDGNYVSAGGASHILSSYASLFAALVAAGFQMAVVSFCHANAWRTLAEVFPSAEPVYRDLTIDSQRRRLPGRGR
jgi:hypothetical protein